MSADPRQEQGFSYNVVAMTKLPALAVDLQGLAKLVERRGKSYAVLELIQNAWDEDVTAVSVTLTYEGYNKARLVVEDDSPEGFADLSHAFTLFAESKKKSNAEQRGRFNAGDKLVVALAHSFKVETTKGTVEIDVADNSRTMSKRSRERGTVVTALLRMSREEVEEAERVFETLIAPPGIVTTFNGSALAQRETLHRFQATLQTEISDNDGYLRPTRRKSWVEVYRPREGESGAIYEMGIPVVETGDAYHVNVLQKVPLTFDRDNVTPAYLRDIRALTLNEMAERLDGSEASSNWVNDALEDDLVSEAAVAAVLDRRFGERRVIYDPSDPEANKIAAAEGYTVIPGRALSPGVWRQVKRFQAARPAGQVTPSPKPYSPDGEQLKLLPEAEWTEGMRLVADYARMIAREVLGRNSLQVAIAREAQWPYAATYGPGQLVFNLGRLGRRWFESGATVEVTDLLIHEFGHEHASDHLSRDYYKALTSIGARLVKLALERPELFEPYRARTLAQA